MLYFLLSLVLAIFFIHTVLRFIDSLHMFQQNLYDTKRYFSWLFTHSEKALPLLDILPLFMWVMILIIPSMKTMYVLLTITGAFYLLQSYLLYKKQKEFVKKPLVLTPRAWRLIITSMLVLIVIFAIVSLIIPDIVSLKYVYLSYVYIVINLFVYGLVWIANVINFPIESTIRKRFIQDAKSKMAALSHSIDVVGITGSYGKTTTKNIVSHILNESFYTLMTPASYNTPMGITITIRELLKPIHDVLVCEMGAYKVGEIKELADIAQPKYGILTAIGPQHLNTFKTIENVQKTKFELIESLGEQGVAILNIDDEHVKSYEIQNPCKVLTYSLEDENADFYATNMVYNETGITFDVQLPNKEVHTIQASLLGEHNVQNILAAIAVAYDMEMPIASMTKAIASLPQIEHRLELRPSGHFTIIDDAFNANPVGTKKAIDVLTHMSGKKIVLTPGMIELGEQEDALNEEYGAYMADKVDFVILVGAQQTATLYQGLKTKMSDEQIYVAQNLTDAFAKMYEQAVPGSFVLIANDLPDIYNE